MDGETFSKKRKINEISDKMTVNSINKVRRLNDGVIKAVTVIKAPSKPKLTLNDMNWDILNLIMRFEPKQPVFSILRGVNKQFYYLISKHVTGLTFTKSEITSKMFFKLAEKSREVLTHLNIRCRDFKFISPTVME